MNGCDRIDRMRGLIYRKPAFQVNLVNIAGNRMDYKNGEKIVLNSCLDAGSLLAG